MHDVLDTKLGKSSKKDLAIHSVAYQYKVDGWSLGARFQARGDCGYPRDVVRPPERSGVDGGELARWYRPPLRDGAFDMRVELVTVSGIRHDGDRGRVADYSAHSFFHPWRQRDDLGRGLVGAF